MHWRHAELVEACDSCASDPHGELQKTLIATITLMLIPCIVCSKELIGFKSKRHLTEFLQ